MLNKIVFKISIVFLLFVSYGCDNIVQISDYQISDICKMSPRKLEKLNNFRIEGIVSENMNIGFINAYIISDKHNNNKQIFVISEKNTSPGLVGESVRINLKLYKELSFGGESVIFFKEYSKE